MTSRSAATASEPLAQFADRGLKLVVVDVKEPAATARTIPERFGWTSPFLVDEGGYVSERFAPKKEGLAPEVAIINTHLVVDLGGVIRFAEYLNMERFDIHATSVGGACLPPRTTRGQSPVNGTAAAVDRLDRSSQCT